LRRQPGPPEVRLLTPTVPMQPLTEPVRQVPPVRQVLAVRQRQLRPEPPRVPEQWKVQQLESGRPQAPESGSPLA